MSKAINSISSSSSAVSLLDSLIIRRVTPKDTLAAFRNIEGYAVQTPLVKLNYRRPDYPDLEIYLKLETLQPINSFKVRGAVNKVLSVITEEEDLEVGRRKLRDTYGNVIVSASAGNMGQGVAFAAKSLGCECIVIVPDHAPQTKLDAMEKTHGAQIIKVPFARWWEILITGDASLELKGRQHLFVHPVCDPFVMAGNSTVGLEILRDLPDCDAVFCSWGGGGCSSGIGSVLKNVREKPDCFPNLDVISDHTCDMVSVEPATAAPLCYSFNNEKTLTPLPTDSSDPNAYQASWIDGCGGKSVLKPMWEVAKDVLTDAYKVELEAVERALKVLVEKNRVVAEGAGACPVAAAMFGPVKKHWKKVVAVVCGGCINTDVLTRILNKDFSKVYTPSLGFSFTQPIRKRVISSSNTNQNLTSTASSNLQVLSKVCVRNLLPMKDCIEAVEEAFIAYSNGTGGMPLRQVVKLPFLPSDKTDLGFLGSMPSYTLNNTSGDYVSCKCISVYPHNSLTGGQFSSHQGLVLLWNKSGHGELLLIADAHEITKIRTAAASAVATRTILGKNQGCHNASVLSILGTGEQALSHAEAMMVVLPNLENIKIWGRNKEKAEILREKIQSQFSPTDIAITVHETVASCIDLADVICTVTSSTSPIITKEHIGQFKPGCHLNAVGACAPQFHELDSEIYQFCVEGGGSKQKIITDSVDACLKEPGDVLTYLNKEMSNEERSSNFVGLGDLLVNGAEGKDSKREDVTFCGGLTIFKSLGIALEDLYAAKVIYEKMKN